MSNPTELSALAALATGFAILAEELAGTHSEPRKLLDVTLDLKERVRAVGAGAEAQEARDEAAVRGAVVGLFEAANALDEAATVLVRVAEFKEARREHTRQAARG